MATADAFARRMSQIGLQVEKNSVAQTNKIALRVLLNIIQGTPVDTGQAISNWVVTLGRPNDVQQGPYVPGKSGSTRQANIGKTYNNGMAALADRKSGQAIYISNSLDYIRRLNNGHSYQAPSGYVQSAAMSAVKSFDQVQLLGTSYSTGWSSWLQNA